jgi:hypothetical protein
MSLNDFLRNYLYKEDCFFLYLEHLFINLNYSAMSHEKAKEQTKHKKEPTKTLKEKRLAKKAKKEEKGRQ